MPVSVAHSQVIYDALKACDVSLISALPETWLVHLIRMAEDDPAMTLVRVASEEEAIGVSASAWVLLRTGWSTRTSRADFLNVREDGAHSPGFSRECAAFLARATCWVSAWRRWGRMPGKPSPSILHSLTTPRCTARGNVASRA